MMLPVRYTISADNMGDTTVRWYMRCPIGFPYWITSPEGATEFELGEARRIRRELTAKHPTWNVMVERAHL